MREIDEIWIVKPGGITIFNQSKDQIDPILIGGFFSAIQTFIQQLGEKELKTMQLGDSKITIYNGKENYLFISRSRKNIKDKNILDHLKLVESKFFEQYGDILQNWTSDVKAFENFGKVIQEIFKDTPEKRVEKALW